MVAASQHAPELVSSDPYGDGWVIKMRSSDPPELNALKNGRIGKKADPDGQDEIKVVRSIAKQNKGTVEQFRASGQAEAAWSAPS